MQSYKFLTSFDLKFIALFSMIIDHIGLCFFPEVAIYRIIGRVALVLYAFMLVEGFFHTKNVNKYLRKLFVWGIISEVPFDFALSGKLINWEEQNIFFTLLSGLVAMMICSSRMQFLIKTALVVIIFCVVYFFNFNYSWFGLTIILLFYFFRNNIFLKFMSIGIVNTIAYLGSFSLQIFGALGLVPILFYNGKLGKKMGEWYYSIYPLHLFLFGAINYFLFHH